MAINRAILVVSGEKADYDGTANYFETDQAIFGTPTLTITLSCSDPYFDVKKFRLENVRVLMDPANAVTYQLQLYSAANADDYENASDFVWASKTALADKVAYNFSRSGYSEGNTTVSSGGAAYGLPAIVELEEANTLYYQIDWSGAPGDTKGFIKVQGTLLK